MSTTAPPLPTPSESPASDPKIGTATEPSPDPTNTSDGSETLPNGDRRRSDQERRHALAQQVRLLVTQGARVESQNEFETVVATGQPVNLGVHGLTTLFTGGIWGFGWAFVALTSGIKRQPVTVDEYGRVSVQKITSK